MNSPNPFVPPVPAVAPRRAIVRRSPRPLASSAAATTSPGGRPISKHWKYRHEEFQLAKGNLAQLAGIASAAVSIGDHVGELADRADAPPGALSAGAFSLVADVRQLGDWVFDKQRVDACSALEKLDDPANQAFRDRVVTRVAMAGLTEAVRLIVEATDPAAFGSLQDSPRSLAVYAELQRRASLLLEAEWLIARRLRELTASDWPPPEKPAKPASSARTK
jgi:hypothetical protein